MNKKSAFIVVVQSRRKMDLRETFRCINATIAASNFVEEIV
jgi:hypothetical protein